MLVPNKMQHVLCTGNLTSRDSLEMLRSLAPNVHCVRGDFDSLDSGAPEQGALSSSSSGGSGGGSLLPESKVVTLGSFRVGLIHGHQLVPWNDGAALAMKRRELDVDILISGHTHRNMVMEIDGGWYINPGSITGAYGPLSGAGTDKDKSKDKSGAEPGSAMYGAVVPSFILLAVQGGKVVCYCYEMNEAKDTVEVSKTEFSKKE